MMTEIIQIDLFRQNDKVVVCMLMDTRDTYQTKSDHTIIMMYMYLYVFGCVLCLCC